MFKNINKIIEILDNKKKKEFKSTFIRIWHPKKKYSQFYFNFYHYYFFNKKFIYGFIWLVRK